MPNVFRYILVISTFCSSMSGSAQSPLLIPDTLSGNNISLTIQDSVHQFYPGKNAPTIGYNGSYLGPTLFLNKGQNVTLNVLNKLTDTTTTHWHGLHVSPANDGGPHNVILPSTTWSPAFTVMDNAGTYWYHPHTHMKTFNQMVKGATGMIVVRDSVESSLSLPRTYGVDDVPLIFQFKTMDTITKQIVMSDSLDNVVMANGVISAYVNSPAQVVRYRILNASSMRIFRFGFEDNRIFYQITSDAGLLDAPVPLTRLTLAVGERAEILVNLTADLGDTVKLNTYGQELIYGYQGGPCPPPGEPIGPLDDSTVCVLDIRVTAPTANPVTTIPSALTTNTIWPTAGVPTRIFTLDGHSNFFINATPYNMQANNFMVDQEDVEIWEIQNLTAAAHPFHVHGNHFYILSRDGVPAPLNERGRKDVVLLGPGDTVHLITRFETFCDTMMPYMYHCHNLIHEDMGMMGQFMVGCPGMGMNENPEHHPEFLIYPNPGSGHFWITSDSQFSGTLTVMDHLGRKTYSRSVTGPEVSIDISHVPSGIYFLRIEYYTGSFVQRIVIQK